MSTKRFSLRDIGNVHVRRALILALAPPLYTIVLALISVRAIVLGVEKALNYTLDESLWFIGEANKGTFKLWSSNYRKNK